MTLLPSLIVLWEALLEYCIDLEIENARYASEKVEKYLNARGVYLIDMNEPDRQKNDSDDQ